MLNASPVRAAGSIVNPLGMAAPPSHCAAPMRVFVHVFTDLAALSLGAGGAELLKNPGFEEARGGWPHLAWGKLRWKFTHEPGSGRTERRGRRDELREAVQGRRHLAFGTF